MNRAAFLDRDGVINEDRGYVYRASDFHYLPGVFDAARRLKELGFLLVVVTNQSGIGRGIFTERDFADLTHSMRTRFAAEGAPLAAVYHCPHHPDAALPQYRLVCDCRKPMPGMLFSAARDLDIALDRSVMFGDSARDLQAAETAGVPLRYLIGRADGPRALDVDASRAAGRFDSLANAVESDQFARAVSSDVVTR